jgi:Flp pilus assembly CpaF family ATPase
MTSLREAPVLQGQAEREQLADIASAVRSEVLASFASRAPDLAAPRSLTAPEQAGLLVDQVLDRRAAARAAAGEPSLGIEQERLVRQLALSMLFGLGALQLYIDDASVENIDVNGHERAFVTYADGAKKLVGPVAASDEELVSLVRSAGARFGLSERRFDAAQPEIDLRLPDGSRLSAVMGVTEHPVVDIRRHRMQDEDLAGIVALGMLDEEIALFLARAVESKQNILVSGAMNAGKTTLLRALAAAIPPEERIVTIEQALELGLERQTGRHPDCVAMEARLANTEGEGAIGMARLVRRSLRMNASRVIVGEVLGDEIIPMLNAMSQGRSGSMATIHADSSAGVFRRIAAYAVQAPERLPLEATNLLIAGAIHFVVHLDWCRSTAGRPQRRVVSVREVIDADGPLVISNEIWQADRSGAVVRAAPLSERAKGAIGAAALVQDPAVAPWA